MPKGIIGLKPGIPGVMCPEGRPGLECRVACYCSDPWQPLHWSCLGSQCSPEHPHWNFCFLSSQGYLQTNKVRLLWSHCGQQHPLWKASSHGWRPRQPFPTPLRKIISNLNLFSVILPYCYHYFNFSLFCYH